MTTITETPEATRIAVADLQLDHDVDQAFACTRKERRIAKGGKPYLALELRDRTGKIPARVFIDADKAARSFERGDVVQVAGRVEMYRGELFVFVHAVSQAAGSDVEAADFLPVAYRDVNELDGFLEHLAREVWDTDLKAVLAAFLDDAGLRAELRRAPCTTSGHHAYLGGLIEHTVAVASLALETRTLHQQLDSDLLLTAAILHDIGKTREFEYGATISLSREGRLVGHLALGQQLLIERAQSLAPDRLYALQHCIQGHHGPQGLPEGGFQLPEAVALHRLNATDVAIRSAACRKLPK